MDEQSLLKEVVKAIKGSESESVVCVSTYLPQKLRDKLLEWKSTEEPPEEILYGGLSIPQWEQIALLGDVLVELKDGDKRYLKRIIKTSEPFICFTYGRTSETEIDAIAWDTVRLIESTRWRPNPGHQPVPDKVIVEVTFLNGEKGQTVAKIYKWKRCSNNSYAIIAFRIIGTEDDISER